VLDTNSYKHQAPQSAGGGEQNIYFAPMLKEKTINNTPPFMDNIKGLIAMQISPLNLVEKNIDTNKVTATKLLSSSNESWLMKERINLNPMFITPPKEQNEMKSYDLAYILQGEFTSFFKGKAIPEKDMGEEDIKEEDQDESKEETSHLNDEDKIATLRSKQQTLNPIAQTTALTRGVFKALNIIALPVLVILFGLLILAKRTSRKKKIANWFNTQEGR